MALTSTSLLSPQAFHLIYSSCSGGHHGRGLIKLVIKLQDTFSNPGARPRLLLCVIVYSCSTLTPSHVVCGLCRWTASKHDRNVLGFSIDRWLTRRKSLQSLRCVENMNIRGRKLNGTINSLKTKLNGTVNSRRAKQGEMQHSRGSQCTLLPATRFKYLLQPL